MVAKVACRFVFPVSRCVDMTISAFFCQVKIFRAHSTNSVFMVACNKDTSQKDEEKTRRDEEDGDRESDKRSARQKEGRERATEKTAKCNLATLSEGETGGGGRMFGAKLKSISDSCYD